LATDLDREKQRQNQQDADDLKQLRNDIGNTFNNPSGVRVLRHILGICGIYSDGFTGDNTTFYNAGMRGVGLRILEDVLDADYNIYIKVLKEEHDAR
jgi:hypothetical protein